MDYGDRVDAVLMFDGDRVDAAVDVDVDTAAVAMASTC